MAGVVRPRLRQSTTSSERSVAQFGKNRAIGIRGLPIRDICARSRILRSRATHKPGWQGVGSPSIQEPSTMQIKVYVPKADRDPQRVSAGVGQTRGRQPGRAVP